MTRRRGKQDIVEEAAEEAAEEATEDARPVTFPTFVYKCPGSHQCHGGTYDHKLVADYDQLAEALKAGWFETLPEAMEAR